MAQLCSLGDLQQTPRSAERWAVQPALEPLFGGRYRALEIMEKIEDVAVSLAESSRPSRAGFLRAHFDEDRSKHPYRYVDVNSGSCPLFVENVAQMLGCHVDFVRRIPRTELPVSRVGRRVLYLREDVFRYIASKKRGYASSDQLTAAKFAALTPDSPKRSQQPFDPIHVVNQTKEKDRANGKKK